MAGVIVDIALSTAWWTTRTVIGSVWDLGKWSLGYTESEPSKDTQELLLDEIKKLREEVAKLKKTDISEEKILSNNKDDK
jgi:hypothetical protein